MSLEYNNCAGQYCECWVALGNGPSFPCINPSFATATPEVDPSGATGAITLLIGCLAVILGRRRKCPRA